MCELKPKLKYSYVFCCAREPESKTNWRKPQNACHDTGLKGDFKRSAKHSAVI